MSLRIWKNSELYVYYVYLGRYGDNDMEQAKTDMVVDCLEDIGKSSLKHTDKELDLDEDKVRAPVSDV